jgi:hypothetical protein
LCFTLLPSRITTDKHLLFKSFYCYRQIYCHLFLELPNTHHGNWCPSCYVSCYLSYMCWRYRYNTSTYISDRSPCIGNISCSLQSPLCICPCLCNLFRYFLRFHYTTLTFPIFKSSCYVLTRIFSNRFDSHLGVGAFFSAALATPTLG